MEITSAKSLKERCELYADIVAEFYHLNKYYLTEIAKDALSNAIDCMRVISGRVDHLMYNFSGCDSHLPTLVSLANNSCFLEQTKDAFRTAYEALLEIFVHVHITQIVSN